MVRRRILVLEDDAHVQDNIRRALRHHDVHCASSVVAGTELGSRLDPEVVICDYNLADGTGREALRALRERGVSAPVLLISGNITPDDWIEWAAALSDDFLPKPFSSAQLRIKVQHLLALDATAREAARQYAELAAVAERDAREAEAANLLLGRLLQRGNFDPATVRISQVRAGRFGGDTVLGAQVGDRYRWLVGDVSGHTLSSALVTIPLSMLFYGGCTEGKSLVEHVASMNEQLGMLLPVSMFCAAVVLELDRARGTLSVWNGGAPDVVIRSTDGAMRRIPSTDPMLAVMRGTPFTPAIVTCDVATGDRVFAFTDGLIDLTTDADTVLGVEATCAVIGRGPGSDAFDRIGDLWRNHGNADHEPDDMTLVEVLV